LPIRLWQSEYIFFPTFSVLSVHFEITGTMFFPVNKTETMAHDLQLEDFVVPQPYSHSDGMAISSGGRRADLV